MARLLDTGALLRFSQRVHPRHQVTRAAIARLRAAGEELHMFPQNMREFWNVATRPADARGGFELTPAQADWRARVLERLFILLPDTADAYPEWRRLVVVPGVSGAQVHDAYLVAAMRAHGLTQIVTFNTRDFARYPGTVAIDPADV